LRREICKGIFVWVVRRAHVWPHCCRLQSEIMGR
jgi:hypothetical protein